LEKLPARRVVLVGTFVDRLPNASKLLGSKLDKLKSENSKICHWVLLSNNSGSKNFESDLVFLRNLLVKMALTHEPKLAKGFRSLISVNKSSKYLTFIDLIIAFKKNRRKELLEVGVDPAYINIIEIGVLRRFAINLCGISENSVNDAIRFAQQCDLLYYFKRSFPQYYSSANAPSSLVDIEQQLSSDDEFLFDDYAFLNLNDVVFVY